MEFKNQISNGWARSAAIRFYVCLLLTLSVPPSASGQGLSPAQLARESARRGEELRRKWELASAESAFREAVRLDPANLEALTGLARVARARFDYAGAVGLLDRAARLHPASAEVLIEYGALHLAAEEPRRALDYFERAAKLGPTSNAIQLGRAGVDLLERDYRNAEARVRRHLADNPPSARAFDLLARVMLESNNTREAARAAEQAIRLDAYDTGGLYALAFVRATERKPKEARELAERAVALDPLNVGARRLLSQYLDGRAGLDQKVRPEARAHYERGLALKQEGRLSEALAKFEAALAVEPSYYRALVAMGDVWLRVGEYERAARAARAAVAVDPEGALAHLELSYACQGLQERARIEIGATDFAKLFYDEPAPPSLELTPEIFPNYKSLTRRQQIVIDRAVAPLAQFLPRLAAAGARHYLMAFDQAVSDIREFDDVAKEKTFDGRYYASIRGVGGRITVSGIEYIETAARGGFHTIAHEFAHQVHLTALSREDAREVRNLYERARRTGSTLDYYAAANEYEYFAQGYEAFISNRKRPGAGVTARHTNRELLARDPELHRFFARLTASGDGINPGPPR
ncbi:MAG TPA: tetratricopeptide repeat protein [Blastocatellia bacterium]|nr:tetratricopeptide repeat protein [Blastocatellia bacterium]